MGQLALTSGMLAAALAYAQRGWLFATLKFGRDWKVFSSGNAAAKASLRQPGLRAGLGGVQTVKWVRVACDADKEGWRKCPEPQCANRKNGALAKPIISVSALQRLLEGGE
jgi:hypothetical protein